MSKQQTKSSVQSEFEMESDDLSSESILIEERARKLLDIGVQKRNIFSNDERKVPPIRRSVIGRALAKRHILSSTPTAKQAKSGYFSEYSLNLSPIDIDEDVEEKVILPVQGEIKTTGPDIVVVDSSDDSDANQEVDKSKTVKGRTTQSRASGIESPGNKSDYLPRTEQLSSCTRNYRSGSKLNADLLEVPTKKHLYVKLTTLAQTSCDDTSAKRLSRNASTVSKGQQSVLLTPIKEANAEKTLTPARTCELNMREKSLTRINITGDLIHNLSSRVPNTSGRKMLSTSRRQYSQQENLATEEDRQADQLEHNQNERISKIPVPRTRSKSREKAEQMNMANFNITETPRKESRTKTDEKTPSRKPEGDRTPFRNTTSKKLKTPVSQAKNIDNSERRTPGAHNYSRNPKEKQNQSVENNENSINSETKLSRIVSVSKQKTPNENKSNCTQCSIHNKERSIRLVEDIGTSMDLEYVQHQTNKPTPASQRHNNISKKAYQSTNKSRCNKGIQSELLEDAPTSGDSEFSLNKPKTPASQKKNNISEKLVQSRNRQRSIREQQRRVVQDAGTSTDDGFIPNEPEPKSPAPLRMDVTEKAVQISLLSNKSKEPQRKFLRDAGTSTDDGFILNEPEPKTPAPLRMDTTEKAVQMSLLSNKSKEPQRKFVRDAGTSTDFGYIPNEGFETTTLTNLPVNKSAKKSFSRSNKSRIEEIHSNPVRDAGVLYDSDCAPNETNKTPTSLRRAINSSSVNRSGERITNFPKRTISDSSNNSQLTKQQKRERLDLLISKFQERKTKDSNTEMSSSQADTFPKKFKGPLRKSRPMRNSLSHRISTKYIGPTNYDAESSESTDMSTILQKHDRESRVLFSSPLQYQTNYFTESSDDENDMYNETDKDIPWRYERSIQQSNRYSLKPNFLKNIDEMAMDKMLGNALSKKTRQVYARESQKMATTECAMPVSPRRISPCNSDNSCSDEHTPTADPMREEAQQKSPVCTPSSRKTTNQRLSNRGILIEQMENIRKASETSGNKLRNIKVYQIKPPKENNAEPDTNNRTPMNSRHAEDPAISSDENTIDLSELLKNSHEPPGGEPVENATQTEEVMHNDVENVEPITEQEQATTDSGEKMEPLVVGPEDGPAEERDACQNLLPDRISIVDQHELSPVREVTSNSPSRSVDKQLVISMKNCLEESDLKVPTTKSRKHKQSSSTTTTTTTLSDGVETRIDEEKIQNTQDNCAPSASKKSNKKKRKAKSSDGVETKIDEEKIQNTQDNRAPPASKKSYKKKPIAKSSDEPSSLLDPNFSTDTGVRRSTRSRRVPTHVYRMDITVIETSRKSVRTSKAARKDKEIMGPPKSKPTLKRSKKDNLVTGGKKKKSPADSGCHSDDTCMRQMVSGSTFSNVSSIRVEAEIHDVPMENTMDVINEFAGEKDDNEKGVNAMGSSLGDYQLNSVPAKKSKISKSTTKGKSKPTRNTARHSSTVENVDLEDRHEQPVISGDAYPSNGSAMHSEDPVQQSEHEESSNRTRLTRSTTRRNINRSPKTSEDLLHSTMRSKVTKKNTGKKGADGSGSPEKALEVLQNVPTNAINVETNDRTCELSEHVDVTLNDASVRLRFVETEPNFRFRRDNHLASDPLLNVSSSTSGYIQIPPGSRKMPHSSKKHSFFFFVIEGEGEVRVDKSVSKVKKLSRFIVPVGLEYAIVNESESNPLILGYVRERSQTTNNCTN